MKTRFRSALCALSLLVSPSLALAVPAIEVLGKDYTFPNMLEGLPARLSDCQTSRVCRSIPSKPVMA